MNIKENSNLKKLELLLDRTDNLISFIFVIAFFLPQKYYMIKLPIALTRLISSVSSIVLNTILKDWNR